MHFTAFLYNLNFVNYSPKGSHIVISMYIRPFVRPSVTDYFVLTGSKFFFASLQTTLTDFSNADTVKPVTRGHLNVEIGMSKLHFL